MVPYKFYDCTVSERNAIGILMWIVSNPVTLDNMDILTVFILPIHEHGISFHFFVPLIYVNYYQCVIVFSVQIFTSSAKFILECSFDAVVNRILNFSSDSLLLMYETIIDLCILILYLQLS